MWGLFFVDCAFLGADWLGRKTDHMVSIAAAAKLITWSALQRQQNCDRGEDNKDPDWLIDQSIARQVARGVLHRTMLKK